MKENCVWVVEKRMRNGRWRPWSISWFTKKEANWARQNCVHRFPENEFRTQKYITADPTPEVTK